MSGAHVTAACSARNRDVAVSLGADRLIDYRQQDFSDEPERYDAILGINGCNPLSKSKGTYFLSQTVARVMIGQGRGGRIVNFLSTAYEDAAPFFSAYGRPRPCPDESRCAAWT